MERGKRAYLGEINTESIHVQAVEEGGEALVESLEALVHELEVHEVGFQIGHGVGELGEGGLEGIEGKGGLGGAGGVGSEGLGIAQRGA